MRGASPLLSFVAPAYALRQETSTHQKSMLWMHQPLILSHQGVEPLLPIRK